MKRHVKETMSYLLLRDRCVCIIGLPDSLSPGSWWCEWWFYSPRLSRTLLSAQRWNAELHRERLKDGRHASDWRQVTGWNVLEIIHNAAAYLEIVAQICFCTEQQSTVTIKQIRKILPDILLKNANIKGKRNNSIYTVNAAVTEPGSLRWFLCLHTDIFKYKIVCVTTNSNASSGKISVLQWLHCRIVWSLEKKNATEKNIWSLQCRLYNTNTTQISTKSY